jgi:hypothetical protein
MSNTSPETISHDIENEIELIKERIKSEESVQEFNKLYSHCKNEQDKIDLSVMYRHLLPEFYNNERLVRINPQLQRPLVIGYLLNEDVVFCGGLDMVIIP